MCVFEGGDNCAVHSLHPLPKCTVQLFEKPYKKDKILSAKSLKMHPY